jgi:hypothetical protein
MHKILASRYSRAKLLDYWKLSVLPQWHFGASQKYKEGDEIDETEASFGVSI